MTTTEMIYELAKIALDKTIPAICTMMGAYFPAHALIVKGTKQKRTNPKGRPR
ncbi:MULTISPECIES: hypothetical protein [Paenibacillus]|jgi:hypothetical protein|uniref:hypothetical protein n=1 Tax=Paenibacillus TaxID=44249 RepID=UPI00137674E8|nr:MULTISPECIES: hypothetical protein [Paenibacillus]MDN4078181.1 hypothetical protein [Paenibacillus polymyxa]MDN4103602.1 hypothetical protein [Paenibacillus polymyxa]MDN4113765.1 hypothetical protein [Paenibacillus polymyxa]UMY55347.1 hypothetical protein MLD56_02495 [Paenibacillus peoriae]